MVAPSVSPLAQTSLISCISTPRFAKALQIRSRVAIATSRSVDSTVKLSQYGRVMASAAKGGGGQSP
eukprot:9298692-Heterocapsa_arctica.AAC.1